MLGFSIIAIIIAFFALMGVIIIAAVPAMIIKLIRDVRRASATKEKFASLESFDPAYQFASECSHTGVAIDSERKEIALSGEDGEIRCYSFTKIKSAKTVLRGEKKISKVAVQVSISDLDKPNQEIIFYDSYPVKEDSILLESPIKSADEWAQRINVAADADKLAIE